jgi:hypothetical protein
MARAKGVHALKAYRQMTRVTKDKKIAIKGIPFRPGTMVEVIVRESSKDGEKEIANIYAYTRDLVERKRLPRYSLREIERIIHESRGVGA